MEEILLSSDKRQLLYFLQEFKKTEAMMPENKNRKQELESAVKEYLSQADTHPISDSLNLVKTGDYAWVFGMSSFIEEESKESVYFLTPIDAEIKLMEKVESLFDSQVSPATVHSSLTRAIREIGKFPLSTDNQEQQFNNKLFKLLNFHFGREYDAIVPMYQLECAEGVEFPLANTVLYSGGERSRLAEIASHDNNHFSDADKQQIELCSYLKLSVTGDSRSCLEQIESEVERALQVLRFIYPWFEKDGKEYNPAHGVSMWKHSGRIIIYDHTSAANDLVPRNAEIPNAIFGTRRISTEFLSDAQEFYGLDDINYHIQNSDCNPVSKRICRAISFYDAAAQTSIIHTAFSNFIISVDILLPPQKTDANVLTKHLESLINEAKYYVGKMTLNEQLPDPNETEWPERVRLTTADFNDFYKTRGQILHGNEEEKYKIKILKPQVKKARQIAHNAIRAYAYLARDLHWQTDKEAKRWFKNHANPLK